MSKKENKIREFVMYEKLICSGPQIEYVAAEMEERMPYMGERDEEQLEKRRKEKERINEGVEIPDPERTAPSISRTRAEIRRIINANAWQYFDKYGKPIVPKFLTLTFKKKISGLKQADAELKKFVRRFNHTFKDILSEPLKYLCVPEFQERGAVHYHMILFNVPYLDRDNFLRMKDLWTDRLHLEGISTTKDTATIIGYISKYISKQMTDGRFFGQKRYFSSHHLKKPIVLRDVPAIRKIREQLVPYKKYETTIYPQYVESLHYEAYYLGDGRDIYSLPLDEYARRALELSEQGRQEELELLLPPFEELP